MSSSGETLVWRIAAAASQPVMSLGDRGMNSELGVQIERRTVLQLQTIQLHPRGTDS